MALLTFSATPEMGTTVTVDLDKTELLTHNSIDSDSHWSVSDNIRVAIVTFTGASGQDYRLRFDFTNPAPSADMAISLNAAFGDVQLTRIILSDYDNGELIMGRAEILADKPSWADFDFTLLDGVIV